MLKGTVAMAAMAAVQAMGDFGYPGTQSAAWNNHFDAFGAQDVAKIGIDYNDASVLQVHWQCGNNGAGNTFEYYGREMIEGFFAELFADLYDTSTLAVHYLEEYDGGVFLVWSNAGTGYTQVTDTFVFSDEYAILQQNIVVASDNPLLCDRYNTRKLETQNSWDNHFEAFGAQNVEQILEDYVEESVVVVFDFHTGVATEFAGLDAIQSLFEGLFADLAVLDNLRAPVVDTDTWPTDNTFLVWTCQACNPTNPTQYDYVTDTFVYDTNNYAENGPAIIRQNIVVFTETSLIYN